MSAHPESARRPSLVGGIARALWSLRTPSSEPLRPPDHTVAYAALDRPGVAPRADVYLPERPARAPAVLLVHGGGFLIGSRRLKPIRWLATRLVGRGRPVVAIDYRLIFRGGRLDEALADLGAAVRWWQGEGASRFEVGSDRLALCGLSAGATLTMAFVGTDAAASVDRAIGVFGMYDFGQVRGFGPRRMLRWLLA